MKLVYLTLEQAVAVHAKTIEVSGGGLDGSIDVGMLESVLDHIQNDEYYSCIEDKLAHLFFCADKFHCFLDGNKRIAISLCAQMLLLNGYLYCADTFIHEMENISYHVAAGKINKNLLRDIICAILECSYDENEELRLRILTAIADE
jgi:death on curing protein